MSIDKYQKKRDGSLKFKFVLDSNNELHQNTRI